MLFSFLAGIFWRISARKCLQGVCRRSPEWKIACSGMISLGKVHTKHIQDWRSLRMYKVAFSKRRNTKMRFSQPWKILTYGFVPRKCIVSKYFQPQSEWFLRRLSHSIFHFSTNYCAFFTLSFYKILHYWLVHKYTEKSAQMRMDARWWNTILKIWVRRIPMHFLSYF